MFEHRTICRTDVVVGLVIALMSSVLLLPAIAQNRDAQARSKSANNLKQIALTIHNYSGAFAGKLPPLTDLAPNAPNGAGLNSLFFNILPYIGHEKEYRAFKKDTASYCGPNGVASAVIKEYISPADTTAPANTTAKIRMKVPTPPAPFKAEFDGVYATTSYAVNGLAFGSNSGGIPRTFVDGMSNTIMIAERAQACTFKPSGGGSGDSATAEETVYNLWAYGTFGPSSPSYALLTPVQLKKAGVGTTGQVSPVVPLPNNWSAKPITVRIGFADAPIVDTPTGVPFQILTDNTPCVPGTLQTPHKEGMLVALADGSVRSISPKISQWTFWAATTPSGNETLFSDW
jgi:hypothetical protein